MVFTEKNHQERNSGNKPPTGIGCFREEVMRLSRILSAAVFGSALFVSAASAQEERTIRWGHLNNTDHPVSFGVQKFAEILAAKSGGKLKVREFASSQLGNELQQQSALRGGTQEMLSASTTSLATDRRAHV